MPPAKCVAHVRISTATGRSTSSHTSRPADSRNGRHWGSMSAESNLNMRWAQRPGRHRCAIERNPFMSTWLITGCSTGLGRALAEAVIAAGHNAVVTARDAAKVADLADPDPERVLA